LIDGTYASDFTLQGVSAPINIDQEEEKIFTVRFSPLGTSSRFARIVINSNDPNKPEESIILRGYGKQSNAPLISLDVGNIDFGNVEVTKYKEVSFTITNAGNSTLHIDSLNIVGVDKILFTISNGVSAPLDLNPGDSKQVKIKFLPTSIGSKSANIRIKHNAGGSPSIITFNGTGISAGITINPLSISFGEVNVNSTKDTNIIILNNGSATLTISNVQFAGTDASLFTASNAVTPIGIASGNSFSLNIRFSPNSSGSKSASLVITHNATGSPTIISLDGIGISPGFAVSPTSLSFGDVNVNESKELTMTILNNGSSTLTITNLKISGTDATQFVTVGATTPITITAGNNYALKIKFTPTSAGLKSASLELTHNAAINTSSVSLSGTGVALSPNISVNTTSIIFGPVMLNESKDTNLTIANTGNGVLTISSFTIAGTDASMFSIVNPTTPININPGANYILKLRFSPTSERVKTGNLIIAHNAPGSPTTVNLSGTGLGLSDISEGVSPNTFVLNQNYPNPFNPSTIIEYVLPEDSYITLKIYNSLGIELKVLINRRQSAGRYSIEWNPDLEVGGLPSGVYYYKLQTEKTMQVKKMMYVR
jgi:ribosomal protein L30E